MPRETRRLMTSRTRARTSRPGQAVPTCPESARPRGESGAEARVSTGRSGLGPGAFGRSAARRPPRGVPWVGGERLDMVRPEDLIHPRDAINRVGQEGRETHLSILAYRRGITPGPVVHGNDGGAGVRTSPQRLGPTANPIDPLYGTLPRSPRVCSRDRHPTGSAMASGSRGVRSATVRCTDAGTSAGPRPAR